MSLFKSMMMRKPDKPSLRKALGTDEKSIKVDLISSQNNYYFVIDGDALLHRVCWVKGFNFKKIANSYIQYVRKHYGKCYIVFDGYELFSTKSVEQQRRGKRFKKCPDVNVKDEITTPFTQNNFFQKPTTKFN